MSQKTLFTKSALAVAVALISTQAWSAGFQLNEFSSSGLGRAYSGEGAIADNAGNVSRNPALITMFDRPTFSAGAVYIDPDVNISGTSPSGKIWRWRTPSDSSVKVGVILQGSDSTLRAFSVSAASVCSASARFANTRL